ncbi:MAG: STAS domain-containing protein [Terracidiphilus sp.]|jgi:anti-anti-sigma factor|nr:STAS domain-containing protein [Terracidiphilus sp.]
MNSTFSESPCARTTAFAGPGELTELVRGQEQRLLEQMMPQVRRQSVTLDLRSVERIDAAGIAALISLYCGARETGHSFDLCNVSQRVAEILALVGVDRILLSHNAVQIPHSGPRCELTAA